MPKAFLKVQPDQITVPAGRFRKDMGDLDRLAQSIHERGLLNPITVLPNLTLLAGARRLEACKKIKLPEVDVHVVDGVDALMVEWEENAEEVRKNFTTTELVQIADALKARAGDGRTDRGDEDRMEGPRRDKIAELVGLSGATYSRAKRVVDKGAKELKAAMDEGVIPVRMACQAADLPKTQQKEIVKKVVEDKMRFGDAYAEVTGAPGAPGPGDAWEDGVPDPVKDGGKADRRVTADRRGTPLPAHLRDPFSAPILTDLARNFRDQLATARNAGRWNPYLPLADVQANIKLAIDLMLAARPFAVCPACRGDRRQMDKCKACRRAGWMDENTYTQSTHDAR